MNMLFFLSAILSLCTSFAQESLKVKTALGVVQGYHKKSYDGKTYTAFEGIPYAKPPVGDLRFAEPQPPEKWEGVLMANQTYSCLAYLPFPIPNPKESEDCLYVYVYVPRENINEDENLDVVVHIHGGAFMLGSPEMMAGPDYIMSQDVVFVSFNYRLAIMGFLSTEDDVVSGNNGLKDQSRALLWIKENIKNFGGNPDSITLTGLSAGGCSVHFHYFSNWSKGLFHKGLSQSGTALVPWALTKNPLENAKKVAQELNCSTESSQEMVDCLRKVEAKQLMKAMKVVFVYMDFAPIAIFGPTLEKGPNPFLPDHPYKLLKEGKVYDVPWIASNVNDEGIFPVGLLGILGVFPEIDKRWDELMPYILDFHNTVTDPDEKINVARKIKEFYFKNAPISQENSKEFIKLISDRMFFVDSEKAIRLHAQVSKSPVYYYWMSYQLNKKSLLSFKETGVVHSDDTRLFLRIKALGGLMGASDIMMMRIFTKWIADYAKTGKPHVESVEWIPVSPEGKYIDCLEFSSPDDIQMKKKEKLGEKEFWQELPIQENDKIY